MTAAALTGSGVVPAAAADAPATSELLRGERLRALGAEARLLLAAARLALRDAALAADDLDPEALGVAVATCGAGHDDYAALFLAALDPERPPPSLARGPQTGMNAPAALVSIRLGAAGPNATLSNGAAGGFDALRYALDAIAAGRAAAMVVAAVDLVPAEAGAPAAGGAAALVLEAPGARACGVRARVAGVATAHASDGAPARACERCRRAALADAGVGAAAVAERVEAVRDAADGVAALAQLADAAERLHRGAARGPLLLGTADAGGGAGAAVLLEADREAAA